ncbi:CHAP domain-containing protein [Desulfosporosinus shakirovi]|uniref:CHAP domain-containing protein n=1 Tax=Desulfosporosinus shakirovi TaxID=2885154 RepID=UPI001E323485|nr:CHAP domain-containing protein [Desulfosporosinus sp. SRJS8]MCB8818083.1 CHAP domain-containing protein [Desulfosporosinus sp. SRJS8]
MDDSLGNILANLNDSSCYGTTNCNGKFNQYQCTWYCWGRAKEKTRKSLSFNGSANGFEWYSNINTSNVSKRAASLDPAKNSIASFSGGSQGYGHVLFIEDVANGYTYFTEYNFVQSQNAKLQKTPTSSFATFRFNFTLNGYIVI